MSNKDIYLIGFYYMKPRPGVNTAQKGWMDDKNNIRYDERIEITRGLKKDTYSAGVILNLTKKTVDRNRMHEITAFDDMFKYFFKGYHQYVTEVMAQIDIDYFNRMLDEMQSELDKQPQEE